MKRDDPFWCSELNNKSIGTCTCLFVTDWVCCDLSKRTKQGRRGLELPWLFQCYAVHLFTLKLRRAPLGARVRSHEYSECWLIVDPQRRHAHAHAAL
jgi:hypothetical protein